VSVHVFAKWAKNVNKEFHSPTYRSPVLCYSPAGLLFSSFFVILNFLQRKAFCFLEPPYGTNCTVPE
jgi:hypothetical protein